MANPSVDWPEKLAFLFRPARYKVAHGGRGGLKSWNFARALILRAAQRKTRVLCARELQKSIADSVHKLLDEQISALGLAGRFDVQKTMILGVNGSEFIFCGLRTNAAEIKSMEGVDICWVEEAQGVSAESWKLLTPTIRKAGSEIWVTFNPDQETDATYQRFVVHPPPSAIVVQTGWQDNPWFPKELQEEKDHDYRVDTEAAEHVWGGRTRQNTNANVLRGRYRIEAFDPEPGWDGPYFGADWGFAEDPTTLVKLWISGRTLYVEHEAYGVGVDIDKIPTLFEKVPGAREHEIRADSARPETISFVRQDHEIDGVILLGYPRIVSATKGPGSIEDGVEHLRSYEAIVIHPRCIHWAEEARLYSFKVDRLSGQVLADIVDAHNHCIDATRYALEPVIKARKLGRVSLDLDVGAQTPSFGSFGDLDGPPHLSSQ